MHQNSKFNKIKGYFNNKFKGSKGIGSPFASFGTNDLRNLKEIAHLYNGYSLRLSSTFLCALSSTQRLDKELEND